MILIWIFGSSVGSRSPKYLESVSQGILINLFMGVIVASCHYHQFNPFRIDCSELGHPVARRLEPTIFSIHMEFVGSETREHRPHAVSPSHFSHLSRRLSHLDPSARLAHFVAS